MFKALRIASIASSWLFTLATLTVLFQAIPGRAESGDILGPGDNIRVTVFQNPDLTTETRISQEGTIRMPLIGEVGLAGLSPGDAGVRIAKQLKDGQFLVDPQVTLTVLQVRSRQVSILGQVAHPGRYALDETRTRLTDALALAGGITPAGDETVNVMTTRDGKPVKLAIDVATIYQNPDIPANIEIVAGDTIFAQKAPVFYIYGEVQHAGAYRLEKNLNVVQALSLGGGITLRGTERGMKISRRGPNGSLNKIDAQPGDKVQADDVIYVSESFF
ncbi:Capsule polysaccharide export protein [Georgfuchsia toluolica]|uniref:Capsule polysaccharide export protein n=1 Tax=Georgfuchsia toluolica TaxID=424218 RepID=A0A916J1J9_9PROT|nr:polysaccharide export protein EpsE [Georgfuchsia toluolica]CAG4882890.1 Capsule polysaccharide export protein [Georgfuchsia toluolica]